VANVAISNVPGSPVPLYLAGAKMLDYYPVSIAAHSVALNITVQSYMGQLCFGLIACRRAVPDVRDITVYMQRAFEALGQLTPAEASALPAAPAAQAGTKPRRKAAVKAAAASPPAAERPPARRRPKLRVVAKAAPRPRAVRAAKVAV
jgi:hypothetical protein